MPAGKYNFLIDAGSDIVRSFVWSGLDGQPFDISGYTARLFIKRSSLDNSAQHEFTTENGGLVIDGPAGRLTLNIANAVSKILAGTYVYDLEVIDLSGKVRRIAQGYITVSGEVTK